MQSLKHGWTFGARPCYICLLHELCITAVSIT
jgi:hypothetical protein